MRKDGQGGLEGSHGEGFAVIVLASELGEWLFVLAERNAKTHGVVHGVELLLGGAGAVLGVEGEHRRHPPFVDRLHFRRRRVHDVLLRQQQAPLPAHLHQVRRPQQRKRRRHGSVQRTTNNKFHPSSLFIQLASTPARNDATTTRRRRDDAQGGAVFATRSGERGRLGNIFWLSW